MWPLRFFCCWKKREESLLVTLYGNDIPRPDCLESFQILRRARHNGLHRDRKAFGEEWASPIFARMKTQHPGFGTCPNATPRKDSCHLRLALLQHNSLSKPCVCHWMLASVLVLVPVYEHTLAFLSHPPTHHQGHSIQDYNRTTASP